MGEGKKPFRTLKEPIGPPDHFTFEQAEAAVLNVMREMGIPVRRDVMEPDPSCVRAEHSRTAA